MKSGLVLAGLGLLLFPYQSLIPTSDGNPNGQPYVGQAGSTFDATANPPRTDSTVSYNPMAPLPVAPVATVGPNGGAITAPQTPAAPR